MNRSIFSSFLIIVVMVIPAWGQNTPVPQLFPSLTQGLSELLTLPIHILDQILGRITTTGILPLFLAPLNPLYNTLGRVQCSSPNSIFSFPIFRLIFDVPSQSGRKGRQLDFGGNYACPGTCDAGKCVPFSGVGQGPASFSYFQCACPATSCDANGPIFKYSTLVQGTTLRCDPYDQCTCSGLGPGTQKGYMCNWMNVQINETISVQYSLPAQLAPVRWCACCASPAR